MCNICGDVLQKHQPKGPDSAKVLQDINMYSHTSQADNLYQEKKRACAEEGLDRKNLIPNGQRDKLSLNDLLLTAG